MRGALSKHVCKEGLPSANFILSSRLFVTIGWSHPSSLSHSGALRTESMSFEAIIIVANLDQLYDK